MKELVTITISYRGVNRSYSIKREHILKIAPAIGDKVASEIVEIDTFIAGVLDRKARDDTYQSQILKMLSERSVKP